jgi:phage gp46-like protein
MTQAQVSQAGVVTYAEPNAPAAVSGAGVLAYGTDNAKAGILSAGVLAWMQYEYPYQVDGAGVLAMTLNQAEAAVFGAGALAYENNLAAANVLGAGVLAWVRYVQPPLPARPKAPALPVGTAFDVQLAYNPNLHCCDVVFNGVDFAIDTTPVSAILMTLLSKRRAAPDEQVPAPVLEWSNPVQFNARGGYPGDALDPTGQLVGSGVWLFQRRLSDEQTRADFAAMLAADLAWLETARGLALQIEVAWVTKQMLGYRVTVGETTIQLKQVLN